MFPFPSIIDSTQVVAFRACEQKWAYAHGLNLSAGESLDLHFGGALAAGMEVTRKAYYLSGKSANEAICLGLNAASDFWGSYIGPEGKAKSWDTLLLAFDGYFTQWPLDTDPVKPAFGGKAIEFSFAIPIPEVLRPDPAEGPVVYGGRFDMIGELEGIFLGVDEKSTSSGFGPDWAQKWSLRNQFMGYTWGAQQHGIPVEKFLVRGINVLKTKVDYAQAMPEYDKYLIERWHSQLIATLNRMVTAYKSAQHNESFDHNYGDTCTMFNKKCDFMPLCTAKSPSDWYSMYQIHKWNPLAKNPLEESNPS